MGARRHGARRVAYCGRPKSVLMTPATFVKRPIEWLRAITRHRATVSFAPNFAYDLCVRRVKELRIWWGSTCSCWRVAGCGGRAHSRRDHAGRVCRHVSSGRLSRDELSLPSYGLAEHVLAATFAPRGRRPAGGSAIGRRSGELRRPAARPSRTGSSRQTAMKRRAARSARMNLLSGPSVMAGYYPRRDEDRRDDSRRLHSTRATLATCPTASCSCAAAPRTSSSSTAGSIIHRTSNGPWPISPACAASTWWHLACRGTVLADRVVDDCRAERAGRRRGDRQRHAPPRERSMRGVASTTWCWCRTALSREPRVAKLRRAALQNCATRRGELDRA